MDGEQREAAMEYHVKMQNRLRYTLVGVLFVAAIESVLLAARQGVFHWYTRAALAAYLVGVMPLLWEKMPAKNPEWPPKST
jgi:hypothetical protein